MADSRIRSLANDFRRKIEPTQKIQNYKAINITETIRNYGLTHAIVTKALKMD